MFSGVVFQVIRYRKASNAIQRQQTKVVVFGLAAWFILAGLVGWLFWSIVLPDILPGLDQKNSARLVYEIIGMRISGLGSILLASSFAIAILRYHLYDIDVIIRKTLVYALLTGALALLYFGLVTLLQALSASVLGLQSPVIIVLSTLVIAALFNTLRTRIQDLIDRRFYRRKYDAEKALAQFAMAARNETDIQCLNEALLEVVQETVQPERVSIWIRTQERKR
jgi:hypothetical protein